MTLDDIRARCLALPNAYEKLSHGCPCFFVEKGRQFCSYTTGHRSAPREQVWMPAPPGVQEGLIAENPERFFRPPYVGPSGWIGVYLDSDISDEEVQALIEQAHEIGAAKRKR